MQFEKNIGLCYIYQIGKLENSSSIFHGDTFVQFLNILHAFYSALMFYSVRCPLFSVHICYFFQPFIRTNPVLLSSCTVSSFRLALFSLLSDYF